MNQEVDRVFRRLFPVLAFVLGVAVLIPLSFVRPVAAAGNTILAALACVPENDQVVTLLNDGDQPQDLNGWSVSSEVTRVTIPITGLPPLQPGSILRIHSGGSVQPGSYGVNGSATD